MAKNKVVDLFGVIIPSVDLGFKGLWDETTDEGRKEIKGDLWNLTRYISSVGVSNSRQVDVNRPTREQQEHFLFSVNELYNKNWNDISKHPKLQWLLLTMCSHPDKKTFFHEWIPLQKQKNKKEEFLANLFPNMKWRDVETLAVITTDKEIKEYCKNLGWDQKQINGIKL